jgi:hypothetical protein
MQGMLEHRGVGLGAVFAKDSEIEHEQHFHVDDNFLRLCQVMQIIPENHPYVYHKYVVWVLIRPIPRVFWPGKPVDPGFDPGAELAGGGASLSLSAVGELYMSGGFLAILAGGWLFGRLAGMLVDLLRKSVGDNGFIIYSFGVFSLFLGMRSSLALMLVNYAIVAWLMLTWFVTRNPEPEKRVRLRESASSRSSSIREQPGSGM